MNKKDIDEIKNKYEEIKEEFYSNNNISNIKKNIDLKNGCDKYYIIKEIINTISIFEKNISNIDYIIDKIYFLHEEKNENFIILYYDLKIFFDDFKKTYELIDFQIKNIFDKFNM